MAAGVRDAALVSVEGVERAWNLVHVAALLDQPPPVLVIPTRVVVGDGPEIQGGSVQHIAVEVHQRTVAQPAVVPGEFGVAMKLSADDAVFRPVNEGSIGADNLDILLLVGMDHGYRIRVRFTPVCEFQGPSISGSLQPGAVDVPNQGLVRTGELAAVGGPHRPEAAVRGEGSIRKHGESAATFWKNHYLRPLAPFVEDEGLLPVNLLFLFCGPTPLSHDIPAVKEQADSTGSRI